MRQHPDKRVENRRRIPIGLQRSEQIRKPEVVFSLPEIKICTSAMKKDVNKKNETYKRTKIIKDTIHIKLLKS